MIEPQTFATWMGKLADRFNRPLLPPTAQAYYAQLSPLLSTEEFERAAALVFRDESYPWPAPRVFVEKVRSNAPPTYRALPAGAPQRQTFSGDCFEKDNLGRHIEHKAVCACGTEYVQFELALAWMDAIAEGPRRAMLAAFPTGRCPTECPRCARRILSSGISHPDLHHHSHHSGRAA